MDCKRIVHRIILLGLKVLGACCLLIFVGLLGFSLYFQYEELRDQRFIERLTVELPVIKTMQDQYYKKNGRYARNVAELEYEGNTDAMFVFFTYEDCFIVEGGFPKQRGCLTIDCDGNLGEGVFPVRPIDSQ